MTSISTLFDPNNFDMARSVIMWFLLQQPTPYSANAVTLNEVLVALWPDDAISPKLQSSTLAMLRNLEVEGLIMSIPAAPPADGRALKVYISPLGETFARPNAWAEGAEAYYSGETNPYPISLLEHTDWAEGHANAAAWGGTTGSEVEG